MRILVVDDAAFIRDLLRLHLTAAGYEVILAADAIAAGKELLQSVPDLILCDVEMPHMDGFEFVAALRADSSIPRVPVIFLTSKHDGHQRAKELGACAYLTKPLLATDLVGTVARYVSGGQSVRASRSTAGSSARSA